MAKKGQPDLKFGISTTSASTTIVDLSGYIDTFNGVSIEALIQQSDGFGDAWQENTYVGVKKGDPFTIEGFYDDVAASGPHAILGQTSDLGAERNFEVDFGSSDLVNGDVLVTKYERMPRRNELTRFRATLQPTGTLGTAS